jgi:NTP pyrophosphatase (non-canonical NTP hydrolase)
MSSIQQITELDVYQQEAIKTLKPMTERDSKTYCAIKLCTEAGEAAQLIAKHIFHGKELNKEALKDELSDTLWYLANFAYINDFSLSEIATYNIEKLRKRHGETYNKEFYTK